MPLKVGTKYQCTSCNSEFIVIKPGEGQLACCGQLMNEKENEK